MASDSQTMFGIHVVTFIEIIVALIELSHIKFTGIPEDKTTLLLLNCKYKYNKCYRINGDIIKSKKGMYLADKHQFEV